MSQYELSRSITAATDALDQVVSLQELLFISLDIAGQSAEKRQQRTDLLLNCYLYEVKPYLEELRQELQEIRQLVPRGDGGQMSAKHSAGLAAEKV